MIGIKYIFQQFNDILVLKYYIFSNIFKNKMNFFRFNKNHKNINIQNKVVEKI